MALGFTGDIVAITEAQSQLLEQILEMARVDDEDRRSRWAGAEAIAREYAQRGLLLLGRGWVFDFVLSQDGVVHVVPTESPYPQRSATPWEEICALYPAIRVYPELLSFLPRKSEGSIECPSCKGTGFIGQIRRFGSETVQPNCICGGAGWVPKDYEAQLSIGQPW